MHPKTMMLQEFKTEGHHALKFYHEIRSRGIPAGKPFVGNRMWVSSLSDPIGHRLEFESPTEVAEDTQFQEAE